MPSIRGPHIPYKQWFAQPNPDPAQDHMNWLEVERWAARLNEQVGGPSTDWEMTWGVPALVWIQGSASFVTPIDAAVSSIVVSFTQPPTGGNHTIRLYKDGVEVWVGTVPAATNPWVAPSLPAGLSSTANTTRWRLAVTSVGSGSPTDQSVVIRFS